MITTNTGHYGIVLETLSKGEKEIIPAIQVPAIGQNLLSKGLRLFDLPPTLGYKLNYMEALDASPKKAAVSTTIKEPSMSSVSTSKNGDKNIPEKLKKTKRSGGQS